jgi:hypothetical protein
LRKRDQGFLPIPYQTGPTSFVSKNRHAYLLLFQYFGQPIVNVTVPIDVHRPFVTVEATGFIPLLVASGAASSGFEGIPLMPAGTHPQRF